MAIATTAGISCSSKVIEFGLSRYIRRVLLCITIIDNSYASPIYQNPIEMGVDIVVHSATKYLNGHSDVVIGVLCSSHKIVRHIFEGEYMTLGGIISPNDAWLLLRGLRTLPIRMKQTSETAAKVVEF